MILTQSATNTEVTATPTLTAWPRWSSYVSQDLLINKVGQTSLLPALVLYSQIAEPSVQDCDWMPSMFERVISLSRLPENWDTYHGVAPDLLACVRAIEVLSEWHQVAKRQHESLPRPFVAAASDGGIHIEWDCGRKQVEVVVPPKLWQPFEWLSTVKLRDGYDDREGTFRAVDDIQSHKLVKWLITEK